MKKLLPSTLLLFALLNFSASTLFGQTTYNMCSGGTSFTITDPTGDFYDSGGPTGTYQNIENCTLLIAPPGAAAVTMYFTSLSCEPNYDTLYIYDGTTT